MSLADLIGSQAERAYRRSELLAKRCEPLTAGADIAERGGEAWSGYWAPSVGYSPKGFSDISSAPG